MAPSARTFWIGTTAYVVVILALLQLSQVRDDWAVLVLAAELATLPIGIGWFTGGLIVVEAVADELGWAGALLFYGAFAAAAVVNAVVLRAVFRSLRRRPNSAAGDGRNSQDSVRG